MLYFFDWGGGVDLYDHLMSMGTFSFDNEQHIHKNSKNYNISDCGFGYANNLALIA